MVEEITILYPKSTISKIRIDKIYAEIEEKAINTVNLSDNSIENKLLFSFISENVDIDEEGAEFEHLTEVPDEPFEVAGVGFGCVLMPTEAVVAVTLNYRQLFNPLKGAGEDLSFCWRARKSGYKIICDPRIPLGHVAHTVVNADFYNAYKGAQT